MDVIEVIDMHTGGHPVRIVVKGYPKIEGSTILEKRRYVRDNLDRIRQLLMLEPRGFDGMYGVIFVEKDIPEADMAVLFMHGEGYSTMCGHATISLGRYAVDYKVVTPVSPVTHLTLQCPCGPVKVKVQYENGKTGHVSFESVPSYVAATDQTVNVSGLGSVKYDIVYGGAFYAFVEAESIGLDLLKSPVSECVQKGGDITDTLRKTVSLTHHENQDLAFVYGTILISTSEDGKRYQLCIFAERQVDRSPCGSGVTARVALEVHNRLMQLGEMKQYFNAKTGSVFTGKALKTLEYGGHTAVTVEVGGKGYYSGECKFWLEEDDLIGRGFLL